jgi:DNA-binding FadR family transcriptional regulator
MPQSIRSGTVARAAVFAPLEVAGRAVLVTQRLTDAIVLGVLRDGERLPSESVLARQLGVAIVTAREALETLRGKGLVETKRGRDGGSFVTFAAGGHGRLQDERLLGLSRVQLRDMGVHYSAISGMAAELAADRASKEDVQNLRRIVEAIDTASEGASRRGQGTFRLEVSALSQSARLVREELRLQAEFGPLLWLCLRTPEYRDRCHVVQRGIVDAIAAQDGQAARSLTVRQVADAIDWLIEAKTNLERPERNE